MPVFAGAAAVGLRSLETVAITAGATPESPATAAPPVFKQYREKDGLFYFKLVDAKGQVLLQSKGLASGREAGQAVAALRRDGAAALGALSAQLEPREPSAETLLRAGLDAVVASLQS